MDMHGVWQEGDRQPSPNFTRRLHILLHQQGSHRGTSHAHSSDNPLEYELVPDPDMMRWTPQEGEHEIEEWRSIFNDRRREGRRDRPG
jgi:hypothetical protein